jgi:hypothetical protein
MGTPVERPPGLPLPERGVGGARPAPRAVPIGDDNRVEPRVVLVHARQIRVEHFEAADLLPADVGGELLGGAEGQSEHGRLSWRDGIRGRAARARG